MTVSPEISATADGSSTLLHPVLGEYYHSTNGALAEARHVFVAAGFDGFGGFGGGHVRVLEAGFGSGLNAWLTMLRAAESGRSVDYTAVELYPVAEAVAARMEYASDGRFMAMHRAPWGGFEEVAPGFRLRKVGADLLTAQLGGPFDVVYFDAFAPDVQPQLWSAEVFGRIAACMPEGAILVTYSAKGSVKQALREAGFEVRRLPGAPGKRHMVRACLRAAAGER